MQVASLMSQEIGCLQMYQNFITTVVVLHIFSCYVHVITARNLSCYECKAFKNGGSCRHVLSNSTQLQTTCDVKEDFCSVLHIRYTNDSSEYVFWYVERTCEASCHEGCNVVGERVKLYLCRSCCTMSFCNDGSNVQNLRPEKLWIIQEKIMYPFTNFQLKKPFEYNGLQTSHVKSCTHMENCKPAPQQTEIHFITGSSHKYQDLIEVFGCNFQYKFVHTPVDLVEYQSSSTYEIVYEKCILGSKKVNGPVIVEDTSLCFHAMKNLPGPYVKWFLKSLGPEGLYKLLDAWEDKSAHVECFVAFTAGKDKPVVVFSGRMDGIMIPPQGDGGFGFDPCFSPDEGQLTSDRMSFAEYSWENRCAISHRCKALRALKDYFITKKPSDIGLN